VIRAVVDTNVLISAVLAPGLPGDVVAAGRAGRYHPVTSPYIIEEFRRVMVRRLDLESADVDRIALAIARSAEVVPVFEASRAWCGDPADDAVIETALRGEASHIVTGDRRLRATEMDSVEFVTPKEFLELLGI
jgi:putative PIN family toxin of toxin-antitoxin system